MDFYLVLKFVHVTSAVTWLGGGFGFVLLAALQVARRDAVATQGALTQLAFMAPRLFVPASAATLVSGLALVLLFGLGWQAWIVLGLAGIAFTALFGGLVLGPTTERLAARSVAEGRADMAATRRLLRLAGFDYVVQFAIVFLMVAKPDWQAQSVLGAAGLAVLLGAVVFLRPPARGVVVA